MKYTEEERIAIGERVYKHELTYNEATKEYDISLASAGNYVRLYKEKTGISSSSLKTSRRQTEGIDYDDLKTLSNEELIDEVIKARIGEERAKKGYIVRGGGQNKEYVSISKKSIK